MKLIVESHLRLEAEIKHVSTKDFDLDKFQKLLKVIFEIVTSKFFINYSALDDSSSREFKELALKVRQDDSLIDYLDGLIRRIVANMCPEKKGFENVILIQELANFPSKNELLQRQNNFVMIYDKIYENMTLSEFQKKYSDYVFKFQGINFTGFLKGMVSMKGKVVGKVRILKRKSEISDFKDGEILISPMTTPDFVPAMKKAAAIVTDEGSITCHASIISRELKIPCIVATKCATSVFKDGDLVKVDADKGIIHKL